MTDQLDRLPDGEFHEPIKDPGLPDHQYRPQDVDPAHARRSELQISGMFALASLLLVAFCVAYIMVDKDQTFLYVTSGDQKVRILARQTLEVVGSFGRLGHYAGQFHHITDIAVDSKGNIYTGENEGRRVQKWTFKGMSQNPVR